MKTLKNIQFLILSLSLIVSCQSMQEKKETRIVSMEAIYLYPLTHTPMQLDLAGMLNAAQSGHYHLIMQDSILFDTLYYLLSNLKPDTTNIEIDARIYCKIALSNYDTLSLVMGSRAGTEINGKVMEDDKELNYLIRKSIGYYNLFPPDLLEHLLEFQDTSRLTEIRQRIHDKKQDSKNMPIFRCDSTYTSLY